MSISLRQLFLFKKIWSTGLFRTPETVKLEQMSYIYRQIRFPFFPYKHILIRKMYLHFLWKRLAVVWQLTAFWRASKASLYRVHNCYSLTLDTTGIPKFCKQRILLSAFWGQIDQFNLHANWESLLCRDLPLHFPSKENSFINVILLQEKFRSQCHLSYSFSSLSFNAKDSGSWSHCPECSSDPNLLLHWCPVCQYFCLPCRSKVSTVFWKKIHNICL